MAVECILVDIDGTIADLTHRLHLIKQEKPDWDTFFARAHLDAPIQPILDVVRLICAHSKYQVVMVTSRPERSRETTMAWLDYHYVFYNLLVMRKDGDHRPDDQVKRDLLRDLLSMEYKPVLALEDRSSVVKMWREEGIVCLQCAEGNF